MPGQPGTRADSGVVFVHGWMCLAPRLYWWGLQPLRGALRAQGIPTLTSRQPRTASVESRARQLAAFLSTVPVRRLVLVGHSMGGLDARWVASRLDPQRRISHVVTLGTPHRGSPLAEWALAAPSLRARLARLLDCGALRDLTPEGALQLEATIPDRPDVRYHALAGRIPACELPPFMRACGERLSELDGENDGVVSLASASRGQVRGPLTADHMGLVGAVLGPPGPGGARLRYARTALQALEALLEEVAAELGHRRPVPVRLGRG